jgi:hypothetical protein
MRGTAIEQSRSRNSHIRARRRVTEMPTGIPSRTLKEAIDLRAPAHVGLLPGDRRQLLLRGLRAFSLFCFASPTPMLRSIFCRRGACIGVV